MSGSSLDCVISNRALAISARPQPRYVLVTQSCTCTSQVINWPTWTVAGGIFTGYYWGLTLATLTLPAAGVTNNGFFRSACIYIPAATACTLSVTDNASPPTGSITSNLSVELLDASLWVTLAKNKGRQDIEEIKVDVGELSRQYNLLEKLVRRLLDEDDEEQVTSNGKRMSR